MNANLNIDKKTIFIMVIIVIYIMKLGNDTINRTLYIIKKPNNVSDNYTSIYNLPFSNDSNEKTNQISNLRKNNKSSYNPIRKKINLTNLNISKIIYINPYFEDEKKSYEYFLSLKKMPKNLNDSIIQKEKRDIFENISHNIGMNITSLDEIHFAIENRFGNELVRLNKMIFYSEIIGVKKIILNYDNNLYIKNSIYDEKYNLTIEVRNNSDMYNNNIQDFHDDIYMPVGNPMFNALYTSSNYLPNLFFIFFNLRMENRFHVIKNEILNNLPKVKINKNDLYIHIRGGDIFSENATNPGYASSYAQYPLCFYTKIIEGSKFNKIYIISEDKLNPIVDKLLEKYNNTIYNANNTLEEDISYLAHAYNIVGSVSSFIISIIKLNDNLKYFWEYDIYQMIHKIYHLHHSIYEYPRNYTIFRMEPSEIYKQEMYSWTRSEEQITIMLNDKCPNKFKIIPPKK